MNRRRFLTASASTLLLGALGGRAAQAGETLSAGQIQARLRGLEAAAAGRLGVQVFDSASGREFGYRADERFMMLSSFKLAACALLLHRVDAGEDSLTRHITYTREALLPWSPVSSQHVDAGMSLGQLCEATITTSDNAAANLILASYGGPAALTAYLRGLGDDITRLDRNEPTLNLRHADPLLDTTTPRAMVATLRRLLLGDALSPASRAQLQQWLLGNTTGGRRLKAGLPADWRIGDKTGTNATDANDIGVIWPPGGAPVLVAVYLADAAADSAARDACIAGVGALVREVVG